MKLSEDEIDDLWFERWHVETLDSVAAVLASLESTVRPLPAQDTGIELSDLEWRAFIGTIHRDASLQGEDWSEEETWRQLDWTVQQRAAVRIRATRARVLIERARAQDPEVAVLLPASIARRLDMLLGQGQLLLASLQRIDVRR